ncbi:hypothetical protein OSB04_024370 [Centaurea solstitialis]|uniref:Uncharacterized protein n=1 Tax=Centaurea solstitialis TaxID=347529 RepID=A0AA38SLL6_9ASTR|nr:hypothetical protein OSB04_024370 [Centaurea solstitialis]
MSIDRRDPNPMKDPKDIQIYNKKTLEQRLYQLLTGVDEKMNPIKRDILKNDPLPTVETAYATIRREVARLNILKLGPSDSDLTEIGMVPTQGKKDKSKLYCTHCQIKKHTKEQCFRLVGYPEWWGDCHKQKSNQRFKSDGKGASVAGVGEDPIEKGQQESSTVFRRMVVTSDENLIGKRDLINQMIITACHVQPTYHLRSSKNWIFDCGATDTMSYDSKDFCNLSPPSKSYIGTASGNDFR